MDERTAQFRVNTLEEALEQLRQAHQIVDEQKTELEKLRGERDAAQGIIKRVWKNAETNGTLPVLLLQDIEAWLERLAGEPHP